MSRLILHIGLEKTGTTSFQAFCADHRERLAALGVCYPRNPACFLGINHAPLAASYFTAAEAAALLIAGRRADRAEAVAALKVEMAGAPLALLSAEHFSSRFDPGRIAALAADVAEFDVAIAVVVRSPLARAVSAYATTVASGRDIALEAFVDELCEPGNPYLRCRATIEAWSGVFGRERMVVLAHREGGDIVAELAAKLLPAALGEAGGYRRNASPSAEAIERTRRANRGLWPALRARLSRRPRDSQKLRLSADQVRRIETQVAGDLEWLAGAYGVDLA